MPVKMENAAHATNMVAGMCFVRRFFFLVLNFATPFSITVNVTSTSYFQESVREEDCGIG